jgi:hypothetical protein
MIAARFVRGLPATELAAVFVETIHDRLLRGYSRSRGDEWL